MSLLSRLRELPLVFVDVETTGASASYGDRVTEIALAKFVGGECAESWSQLVDPQRSISPGITALTGITTQMCVGQPRFAEVAKRVIDMTRGSVIVGHNLPFDLSFVRAELERAGGSYEAFLQGVQCLDTVRLARKLIAKKGNALQKLAVKFGVEVTTAHRALADCMTTAAVLPRILESRGGWDVTLADALAIQGGVMKVKDVVETNAVRVLPLELDEALSARTPVTIVYLDARRNRTKRTVVPIELRRLGGNLTLIAHCQLRNEERMFKLDRIVKLERAE
jgi:DNA polymerase III subunit epsilon